MVTIAGDAHPQPVPHLLEQGQGRLVALAGLGEHDLAGDGPSVGAARLASRPPGSAAAASRPSRPRVEPGAIASRQRLPQAQRSPSGWTIMCPSSPANPCAPW